MEISSNILFQINNKSIGEVCSFNEEVGQQKDLLRFYIIQVNKPQLFCKLRYCVILYIMITHLRNSRSVSSSIGLLFQSNKKIIRSSNLMSKIGQTEFFF